MSNFAHSSGPGDNHEFPTPSAPPATPPPPPTTMGNNGDVYVQNPFYSPNSPIEGDEVYARKLQEEEDRIAAFGPPVPVSNPAPRDAGVVVVAGDDDEDYARRLAQELEDQDIARGLQAREQERLDRERLRQSQVMADVQERNSKCSKRRMCNVLLLSVIVASAVIVVTVFGSSIWKKTGIDDNLPPFLTNDWGGTHSQKDFSRWKSSGEGLTLDIQNALTNDWNSYFNTAVKDWDNGTPDALALTITYASAPDPKCSPVRGIMKVCNNWYGKSGWTGLNEVYYDENGYITYSIAKMNEDYLNGGTDGEKQYVMCHELGHGFGLPHRDESITNVDLGTCLDYTRRPSANQHPDNVDYENLASLYGTVSVSQQQLNGSNRNLLRKPAYDDDNEQILLPPHDHNEFRKGRLLHENENGAIYERNSDNGGTIVSYVLYHSEN